jgi:hypothetical protein
MFQEVHHFQQLFTADISGDTTAVRGMHGGSSCVGSNSCGALFNTAPGDRDGLWFGATHLQDKSGGISNTFMFQGKGWLSDDEGVPLFSDDTGAYPVDGNWPTVSGGHFLLGSNQGMFSSYSSINAFWKDTTNMDNLRGADITAHSVAGSTETIFSNTKPNNVRGGHSVHSNTDETYWNNLGVAI